MWANFFVCIGLEKLFKIFIWGGGGEGADLIFGGDHVYFLYTIEEILKLLGEPSSSAPS